MITLINHYFNYIEKKSIAINQFVDIFILIYICIYIWSKLRKFLVHYYNSVDDI